ncbi:MAG: ABC transporter permease [Actinomycetia bacterium]|nr:ABC transporter permease [Actinomycetes bacterium]
MSTVVETRRGRHADRPEKRPRGGARSSRSSARDSSRLADWKASWRVALKMARRDLRRHRGRSAVVALMVGIPLLLLSWLTASGLMNLSLGPPSAEGLMGNATAFVSGPMTHRVIQTGSDSNSVPEYREEDGEQVAVDALAIPGFRTGGSAPDNAAAIAALTGGQASAIAEPSVRVRVEERNVRMQTLAFDGSAVDLGEKVQLLSGRWPSGPHEALVSEQGVRKGLPESGTFEIVTPEGAQTITITGTGTGFSAWKSIPHLISSVPLAGAEMDPDGWGTWLITDTDMPFSTVEELGRYGLGVQSKALMADPLPVAELPEEAQQLTGWSDSSDDGTTFLLSLGVVLALIIGLLVAPAFAVSASRQRRTLALAASNGATTRQLRRTVLAQALVLGVLAAVLGALTGVGIAAGWAWWRAQNSADVRLPIIDIPWLIVLGFVLVAVIASVTAALIPARRLGRLDIMGVLKGQSVSAPPSKVLPLLGVVLMAAGAAALLYGARQSIGGDSIVALGSIPLVVGALFLVPTALVAAGRLSSALPVALRMATRDAARQRARSVPTVAAVMGGVAALTIGLIVGTSDDKESRETYLPRTIDGQAQLHIHDELEVESSLAVVRELLPDARVSQLVRVGMNPGPVAGALPFTIVTNTGCTADRAMWDHEHHDAQQAAYDAAPDQDAYEWAPPPCPVLGGPISLGIIALPAVDIIERFDFTGAQADQVREGAIVVRSLPHGPSGAQVTAYSGTYEYDAVNGIPESIITTGERSLHLITADTSSHLTGALPQEIAALVPLEVVEAEQWAQGTDQDQPSTYFVTNPAGSPITTDVERLIEERLEGAGFTVERGPNDEMAMFLWITVGVVSFILLVIVLTSTALSLAEQRRDDTTLAAVGATRGTRRAMAAAQGFTAAAIGAVLGLIVGIVPGIAIAYPLTRRGGELEETYLYGILQEPTGPFIAIPYGLLAVVVIGVPILAALIAAVGVRRAPQVTRRPG